MSPTSSIVESGVSPDLFLMQAIRHGQQMGVLDSRRVEALFQELTGLASAAMDGLVLRSSSPDRRQEAVGLVMQRVSLALEEAASARLDRASDVISRSSLSRLRHAGNAIHARMIDRLESVRESMTLTSSLPTALSVLDEIDLANTIEHVFLDELGEGRLAVDAVQPRLEKLVRPRRMASLADYDLAREMLARLSARRAVFDLLPRGRLFAHSYPTDELGDTARIVISRLLVCVAQRESSHLAFDPTPNEIESFRAELDDPEHARALDAWMDGFASAVSSESRELARSYLDVCRRSIRTALPQLLD